MSQASAVGFGRLLSPILFQFSNRFLFPHPMLLEFAKNLPPQPRIFCLMSELEAAVRPNTGHRQRITGVQSLIPARCDLFRIGCIFIIVFAIRP